MDHNAEARAYVISDDDLLEEVCWRLVARSTFGRIIFCQEGEPGALPINCAVSNHTIVFRTSVDSTLLEFSDGSKSPSRPTTSTTSRSRDGAFSCVERSRRLSRPVRSTCSPIYAPPIGAQETTGRGSCPTMSRDPRSAASDHDRPDPSPVHAAGRHQKWPA